MKKVLSLSAVLLAAATVAMAEPAMKVDMNKVKPSKQEIHQMLQARKANHQAKPAKAAQRESLNQIDSKANGLVVMPKLNAVPSQVSFKRDAKQARLADPTGKFTTAPTSQSTNAYYRLSDGILARCEEWTSQEELVEIVAAGGLAGLDPSQYPNGTYLSYNYPYLFSQSCTENCGFERVAGKIWKVNGKTLSEIGIELASNDFFGLSEAYGAMMGGYYIPTISMGRNTYCYGSEGGEGASNSAIFGASIAEPISMGLYNGYDGTIYTGFTNTYGFGKRDYTSQDGYHVTSDATYIYLGQVEGMVIDFIDLMSVSDTDCPVQGDPEEGNYIGATLVVTDAEGNSTYYRTILTEGDERIKKLGTFSTGEGFYSTQINFTDIDEDGFETEIQPMLTGEAMLVLYNFTCPNVDLGIYMTYNDNANSNEEYDNVSRSYYDVFIDGEQRVDEEGYAMLSVDDRLDAVVNFNAYFNCFTNASDFTKAATVTIPAEGGWGISAVADDGTQYNDIDIYSTFGPEDIEIIEYPDWMLNEEGELLLTYDDSYFQPENEEMAYSILMFFAGANALPEGVAGRSGVVKLLSNGQQEFTINVVQGDATALNSIKGDVALKGAIYNMQGVKVGESFESLPAGVYFQNGEKIVK